MIVIFSEDFNANSPDEFQSWRRANEDGFFINVKSKKELMLHRANCPHLEGTERGKEEWGSLTKYEKVCSASKQELLTFVAKFYEITVKPCSNCKL